MNITLGLSVLCSIIYIALYERDILKTHNCLIIFLWLLFIGAIFSLFSENGVMGPFLFINRLKFILLLLPLTLFADSKKKYLILYSAICLSAIVAIGYGFITPDGHSYGKFEGFHFIGRTADMMMMLSLATMVMISKTFKYDKKRTILVKLLLITLFGFFIWAVLFSAIRGAWLGCLVGIFVFSLFFQRKTIIIIILLSVFIFGNQIYKKEFSSIFNFKNNRSNNTRLHLLKTGLDFSLNNFWFGTGVKNTKDLFIGFYESKDEKYKAKYRYAIIYPKNFHNSYLQIYIETGIIFFLLFLFSHLYIIYKVIKYYTVLKDDDTLYIQISIITCSAFFVAQFFHGGFHSYSSSLFYFFLYGSCMVSNNFINDSWSIKRISE